MIKLDDYPKNSDKAKDLLSFFKAILDILKPLDVHPIVDGSLAVFAYTGHKEIEVNDVDASISERDFKKTAQNLEEKGFRCNITDWHVLQVFKDDLKIELGSLEFWLKKVPEKTETLVFNGQQVKMLTLEELRDFYKRGMQDRLKSTNPNDKIKYEALKSKYDLLLQL